MPIYEYRCPEGHTFELFQRMTDPTPSECQICGAEPLQKVLHPAAIHFKGSGFYSTDYGRGSHKKDGSKDGDAPSESAKTDDKKSDKKDKPSEKKAPES
jgi:putative FmdB family regulatory protein